MVRFIQLQNSAATRIVDTSTDSESTVLYRLPYIYLSDKYEKMLRLVEDEIQQRGEEGYDISFSLEQLQMARIDQDLLHLSEIYETLGTLQRREAYLYEEPDQLSALEFGSEYDVGPMKYGVSTEAFLDRVYGGWIGRSVGGRLGQPVEHWTKSEIETWLSLIDRYPLTDFFPSDRRLPAGCPDWLEGRLSEEMNPLSPAQQRPMDRVPETDHTIASLHVLEEYGPEFTTEDVGNTWQQLFSLRQLHTAERIAFLNLTSGIVPPQAALYENPYREWIGAAIRGDVWGYVAPGNPRLAAEFAARDAALSHTKNGIYAEMANSAMVSAAFACKDPIGILEAGCSVVPRQSRLAEALRFSVERCRLRTNWIDAWNDVAHAFGHYHSVHAIVNAAIVVVALMFGGTDFEKTITIAVMSGFDTDSNAATAGSILGVIYGANRLPEKWTQPLHDRMLDLLDGRSGGRISEFARRTADQAKVVASWATPRR